MTMGSHISPGLAAEIRFALDLIQEHGTDAGTLGVIGEIVSRRMAEVEAELAELPDSSSITAALQHALQMVAAELEATGNPPQRRRIAWHKASVSRLRCRIL